MSRRKVYSPTIAAAMVLAGAIAVGANAAGTFVEPGVQVLHEFDGSAHSASFGWAVSELGDVDRDGVREAIVGEPFTDGGSTYVYSGRTGKLLYRFDGASGDYNGFSMADAGDANRDGVPDQIFGARDAGVGARGQVYVYSGKTGGRLLTSDASPHGDSLGSFFVAGVGDVNRDGTPDITSAFHLA